MITQYYTPTRILFGEGSELMAGELLKEYGANKVLVHYGSERIKKSGLMASVLSTLDKNEIEYVLLGGAQPNPRLSLIRKGIELGLKEGVDFILAIGGGSAIDSAKAIGYGIFDKGDVWDFYSGERKPTGTVPLAVILTLAATGSEMSDSSVITNEDGGLKRGCNSDVCRPVFSLLNPALTFTAPPYMTSCGTADIMMHTLERFFHSGPAFDITDRISFAVIRATMKAGLEVLENGTSYSSRASLMWASSLSHNGLTQAGNEQRGDWACHQIEHELSGLFDVAHGAGLTAIWGSWARYVVEEDPSRFAYLGNGLFGKNNADTAIRMIESYFRSIHMPLNLKELGINPSDSQIKEMSRKCTFFGKRTIGSFKVLREEDIATILRNARK